MFVTDMSTSAAVLAVHGELFGDDPAGRDASSQVEALIEPSLLVEIEVGRAGAPERSRA